VNKKFILWAFILLLLAFPYFYFDNESQNLDAGARYSASGQLITLAEGVVHYEIAGPPDATPVVLVHGMSVPYFIWDRNFAALANAGFRVLRYDLYGRGYSDRPDVVYNQEFFDRQLHHLLAALGIDGKVNLIGVSLGAAIALAFADRHPERVRKLCLIDPAGFSVKVPFIAKLMYLPGVGEYLTNVFGERTLQARLKNDFYKPESCPPTYSEMYRMQMRYKGFKRAILSTLRNMPVNDLAALYGRVGKQERPVLLIWGREDQTTPLDGSEKLRQVMPQVEFHIIEEAGHVPQYERPEAVNPILIEFLKR